MRMAPDTASRAPGPGRGATVAVLACAVWLAATGPIIAQSRPDEAARQAAERIHALQREADALASRERTLLDELRALEVEREIHARTLGEAERQLGDVEAELAATTDRIAALAASVTAQRPDVAARIVELYKLRNGGYLRLLLNVGSLQEMGRAYRFAAAMQQIDARRLDDYRRTLAELQQSEADLRDKQAHLVGLRTDAATAAQAAARAAAAQGALIDRIDQRRDLNARLVGELQVARARLQDEVARIGQAPADSGTRVVLPIEPFRGELDWPVSGPVLSRFGRPQDPRVRVSVLNSGIQIGATAGTAVRSVHDGTVSFAAPFSGFGNLVIVDHGDLAYSLYGQLSEIAVAEGQHVAKGAQMGTVGPSVDGPPALYFELRIDANPVDPLQWLKRR